MDELESEIEFLSSSELPREDGVLCDEVLSACTKFHTVYRTPFIQIGDDRPLQWWRRLYREFKWIIEALRNHIIGRALKSEDKKDTMIIARHYRFMVWRKLGIIEKNLNPSLRTQL